MLLSQSGPTNSLDTLRDGWAVTGHPVTRPSRVGINTWPDRRTEECHIPHHTPLAVEHQKNYHGQLVSHQVSNDDWTRSNVFDQATRTVTCTKSFDLPAEKVRNTVVRISRGI